MPSDLDNGDKPDSPPNHENASCETMIDQNPELTCP